MNIRLSTILMCFALSAVGCDRSEISRTITSTDDLAVSVGLRVELVGVVTNGFAPEISGVELWELERLIGQRLRVSGILQQIDVLSDGGCTSRVIHSGHDDPSPLVIRKTGRYYRIPNPTYVLEKKS